MAGVGAASPPSWYTPTRLLAIFCTINMVTYLDRGVIASNGVNGSKHTEVAGHGIQGDFNLDDFQDGVLPAMFMLGLLVASPIFAHMSQTSSAFRLIAIGLSVWSLGVAGCALSQGFVSIMGSRALVGVGEASFVSLAAPFIDDAAPPGAKTKWLACFYMCIPVGVALGYVFGGVVAEALGWRAAFWLEGAMMVPFVLFAWTAPPIPLRGCGGGGGAGGGETGGVMLEQGGASGGEEECTRSGCCGVVKAAILPLVDDAKEVCSHRVYVLTVLGATCYTAAIGAYAFWGPKAGLAAFPGQFSSPDGADEAFGAVTVLAGVVGTALGGVALDRLGASVGTALGLCVVSAAVGCLGVLLAFTACRTLPLFLAVFGLAELFLFASQAPSNAAVLWSVPPRLRSFAMALVTVSVHLLGDVPSPPLVGLLQDHLSPTLGAAKGWRVTMSVTSLVLLPGAAAWGWARWASSRPGVVDYRAVVEEEATGGEGGGGGDAGESLRDPLLAGSGGGDGDGEGFGEEAPAGGEAGADSA